MSLPGPADWPRVGQITSKFVLTLYVGLAQD